MVLIYVVTESIIHPFVFSEQFFLIGQDPEPASGILGARRDPVIK